MVVSLRGNREKIKSQKDRTGSQDFGGFPTVSPCPFFYLEVGYGEM